LWVIRTRKCHDFSRAIPRLSRFKREKDMKSHSVRLSPPWPSSSLARLTSDTSGNDRPGLARRQSRSRSQESFEEVSESPLPPLNATISWRCSPLARGTTAVRLFPLAPSPTRTRDWPTAADYSRRIPFARSSIVRRPLLGAQLTTRRVRRVQGGKGAGAGERGRSGAVGRASGGNLPLDTSYSGEVQSLVDLEAWWYSASDEFTVIAARSLFGNTSFSDPRQGDTSRFFWRNDVTDVNNVSITRNLESGFSLFFFFFFRVFSLASCLARVACIRQQEVVLYIRTQRRENTPDAGPPEIYALQWYKCATRRVPMTERDSSVFLWYVIQMCARAHHRGGT